MNGQQIIAFVARYDGTLRFTRSVLQPSGYACTRIEVTARGKTVHSDVPDTEVDHLLPHSMEETVGDLCDILDKQIGG